MNCNCEVVVIFMALNFVLQSNLTTHPQFSRLLPSSMQGKEYVGKKLHGKLKEFEENKKKLVLIENKVKRKQKQKRTSYIHSISKVSFSEFEDDLKILLDTETHIISKEDVEILKIMAKYAGMIYLV